MPSIAAVQPTPVRQRSRTRPESRRSKARSIKPTCAVCAATMVAAECSALHPDNTVSYLWTCDVCGYGFVTDHDVPSIAPQSDTAN